MFLPVNHRIDFTNNHGHNLSWLVGFPGKKRWAYNLDKAGEYQLARSVYDPAVPDGERDANLCNPVPGYPQIGPDWAVGAEKGTVLNQDRHSRPLRWSREQPEWPV